MLSRTVAECYVGTQIPLYKMKLILGYYLAPRTSGAKLCSPAKKLQIPNWMRCDDSGRVSVYGLLAVLYIR